MVAVVLLHRHPFGDGFGRPARQRGLVTQQGGLTILPTRESTKLHLTKHVPSECGFTVLAEATQRERRTMKKSGKYYRKVFGA